MDQEGNAIATWEQFHPSEPESRVYTRALSAAGVLNATRALSGVGGRAFAPRLAVDDAGNATFVWVRCDDSCLVQTRTRLADGALSPVQRLSVAAADDAASPDVAVDADGNAVFVWVHARGTTEAVHTRSRAVDGDLSPVKALSQQWATHARVALDPQGNAAFVWRQANGKIQARRRLVTGSIGPLRTLSTDGGAPALAVDAAGNAIIVYAHAPSSDIIAHVGL